MSESLRIDATALLRAAPCSLEMPAGTGKTELLAAAVAVAAERGRRSLVLTHTNAGVDAIRRRLRLFRVAAAHARVETITSWAFALVRSYPRIAGIPVGELPDWTLSDEYVAGGAATAGATAIAEVHRTSFDYLFVDEYQDCNLGHHDFVLALSTAIPNTVVFGDSLQAIFTFAGPLADWGTDVVPVFPSHTIEISPHRWTDHNPALGRWLLDIRPQLVSGRAFDFAGHEVAGLTFHADPSPAGVAAVAHSFRNMNESVVLLDKWAADIARHAARLGGGYSVMEEIQGKFMQKQLEALPEEGDYLLALWFADLAKACIIGLSALDSTVRNRLRQNKTLTGLNRAGIETVMNALEQLRIDPSYTRVGAAAAAVRRVRSLRIYRWEGWTDTLEAVAVTADTGGSPVENLVRVREALRKRGRRPRLRVASRTLLVKGLDYDHVVIANVSKMTDPRNLYVALSRARKTVHVIGPSSKIMLQDEH